MTEAIPKTIKEHRYAGILGSIWRAVNIQNGMATIVWCGKRGKGKSLSMFEWSRLLDRTTDDQCRFTPDQINLDPVDFLQDLSSEYPRGSVKCLDDAGLHLYKSDALSDILKKVSKILQNIRYKHPIIMMSLPHFGQLMKDARTMTDLYIEMRGIDERNQLAIGSIQTLKVSPFTGELYRYNVLQPQKIKSPFFDLEIKHWEARPYTFNKPPDDFLREYERMKNPLLNKFNQRLINSIRAKANKELAENDRDNKMDFPHSVKYCEEKIQNFINRKGKIDMTKIMLEVDEKGEQLFSMERAKLIAQVLRQKQSHI